VGLPGRVLGHDVRGVGVREVSLCYWCDHAPPCPHYRRAEDIPPGAGLRELRRLTRAEQLKIRWVRWFHAPADDTKRWCNCGRPYPCQTRIDVIG